ncbi:MAG TPA: hypothetical protein VF624_00120 [Tepidisphaeraceae bacterium]|jgi:hypothetical protein
MDPLLSGIVQFKQAQMASRVQYAVAGKILDSQKQNGAAALKLLEAASASSVKAGDSLVAAATGLGGALDVMA